MPDEDGLIATHYRIDPTTPAPQLEGGHIAYMVIDPRDPTQKLMAVLTRNDLPARPRITLARTGVPVPYAVLPIEYGPGRDLAGKPGWFVVCDALPGPAIGIGRVWREGDLIACLLQPAAAALAALQARGLTHRAINPNNVFATAPRHPVTLGPFWAAPPACHQPAVFEPPYMARCLPQGRGDGKIADDVYALGVTMLAMATGRMPLADQDEAAATRLKLELGSYTALTTDVPLSPLIADLLRGMLAEDPEHRPSPQLLMKPEQARARRVAARPPRRAQLAISVGGINAWSARELAHAMGLRPERAFPLLRGGEVERWLRRHLGDPQLGMRLEDVIRQTEGDVPDENRLQSLLVMRCVAAIDPLGPLVWHGMAVQPDGLGGALVGAPAAVNVMIEEIITSEAAGQFLSANLRIEKEFPVLEDQRSWRQWLAARGPAGGLKRLMYGMNPMLACASPLLAGRPVIRVSDLLTALDEAAATADRARPPIDTHIAAFVAARGEATVTAGLRQIGSFAGTAERMVVLRLFGQLQARLQPGPLRGLASWLVACAFANVEDWRSQKTRAGLQEKVAKAAAAGDIGAIALLVDDAASREADEAGAAAAAARVRQLEEAIAGIARDAPRRADAARRVSTEIVTGLGLIAGLGAVMRLALY